MLRMTLVRSVFHEESTLGLLFIDGKFECFTLEDQVRPLGEKVPKETAIPYGTYVVRLRHSPKFTPRYGHEMLWVTNVPMFEWILIHPGNKESHTDGCVLVGANAYCGPFGVEVANSIYAYKRLYDKVAGHAATGQLELVIQPFGFNDHGKSEYGTSESAPTG